MFFFREKKREQEREELWRKLDELRLQETVQNNRHNVQFTYSNNNNNNNNNLFKDENPAGVITDSSEKLTWLLTVLNCFTDVSRCREQ